MNLDFGEEQQMLRDMVCGLCNEYSPPEVVRAMEDDPNGTPEELWKRMAELGLLGLLIPEAYGGSAQGALEAAIVYEEFGRALTPSPHFPSAVISARLLLESGSEGQKQQWLPQIASGRAVLTPAWLEPDRGFGPEGVQLAVKADGGDYLLSGRKRHVLFASTATRLVVLARDGDDVGFFLVDPDAPGVTRTQQRSLAADTQYDVEFDDVRVAATERIPGGWSAWSAVMHDGIILLAAQAMGGAERAVEMTTEYAKQRKQFDKPLGAFQAISHYLADATTRVDGGKALVYEAAWARGEGRDVARLAPMAKLFACQTYRDVTAMCQQVWGGVGFTIEYDIQLYFRRAKQLQITWWDPPYLEERIARDVLDREAS